LVPAANVTGRDPVQMSPLQEFLVEGLVRLDILYWTALETAPDRLVGTLLATDPRLLAKVGVKERRRAYRILLELMPISARSRGMLNDGRLAGRPARMDFGRVEVPTLLVSVEDDRFGTADTARRIASAMRGARLVIYPSGGHIWLGHDDDVADEVTRFLASIAKGRSFAKSLI
jgi:pimeloyl-ACP methyl ester carboxylesterase